VICLFCLFLTLIFMKRITLCILAVVFAVGCTSSYEMEGKVYEGDGFGFNYPPEWTVSEDEETGLIFIEDLSGTPSLSFSSLTGNFGMAGWEMQKKEDFAGDNGTEFTLIYNKVDVEMIAEGEWPRGQEFLDNDTTFVMISTKVVESPMFYEFDKTDPDGEAMMESILNSFYTN
jgi:hypothetical protein